MSLLRAHPKPVPRPKKVPKRLPAKNVKRAKAKQAQDFGPFAAWIRSLPCCLLGRTSVHRIARAHDACEGMIQAHHVKSRGAGGHAEANLVPLCTLGHDAVHFWGRRDFEDQYGFRLKSVADTLWTRYQRETGRGL